MSTIYSDHSLGGRVTYRALEKKKERPMRLPNEIRECVVFVGCKMHGDDEPTIGGTAFLLSVPLKKMPGGNQHKPRYNYLITTDHVLTDFDKYTGDTIVYLRFNAKDHPALWFHTNRKDWISSSNTDLAVLPIDLPTDTTEIDESIQPLHHIVPSEMVVDETVVFDQSIGVGDEVIVVGLVPKYSGQEKNIPMVRSGIISAMPEEPVYAGKKYGSIDAYLIELRSAGGFSGSPVFVYLGGPPTSIPMSKRAFRIYERMLEFDDRTFFLLGIMHGHWDLKESKIGFKKKDGTNDEDLNTGISIVVPATEIIKLLNTNEELKRMKEEREEELLEEISTTPDSALGEGMTKEDFEESLKRISKPIQPDEGKKET